MTMLRRTSNGTGSIMGRSNYSELGLEPWLQSPQLVPINDKQSCNNSFKHVVTKFEDPPRLFLKKHGAKSHARLM